MIKKLIKNLFLTNLLMLSSKLFMFFDSFGALQLGDTPNNQEGTPMFITPPISSLSSKIPTKAPFKAPVKKVSD